MARRDEGAYPQRSVSEAQRRQAAFCESAGGFGESRVIRELEAARAMQICEQAGINVTQKSIWRDKQKILSGLPDAELRKWLQER